MGDKTKIEWTQGGATWNPWHGCTKVSPGCKFCYMYTEKKAYGQDPTLVVRSKTKFNDPLKWAKTGKPPKFCFTCSWSDFFIEQADAWRPEAWEIIRKTPQITYQILTKRPERISRHLPWDWGFGYPNVWLGVSVETPDYLTRLDHLRNTPAALSWCSFEPLLADLGDIRDRLKYIQWAVGGFESGPNARPGHPQWGRNLRNQCLEVGTAFFWKQNGEWLSISEMPDAGEYLYRSNKKADPEKFEDQSTIDEICGRRCIVATDSIGFDGERGHWRSIGGIPAYQIFKVGKKAAGRLLDGREWNEYPTSYTDEEQRAGDGAPSPARS